MTGTTTHFAWDVASQLPLLLVDGGMRYIYGDGGTPLEQVDASGNVTYFHQDQLGSTRLLTDGSGAVGGTYTFDPYGTQIAHGGTATTALGFAGQYTDAETGLIYQRARYYDPATAQFTTVDPAYSATGSRFGYVAGDPVNLADPSGKCLEDFCIAELAVAAEAVNEIEQLAAAGGAEVAGTESATLAAEAADVSGIATEATTGAGEVAVDTNPVIDALSDPGLSAKVDSALAGRGPVLSPNGLSEITSISQSDVMDWLAQRGGRLGPEALPEGVDGLQAMAHSMGRVLGPNDAAIADSAMQEGLSILTNDVGFARFLRAIPYPVEGY